MAAFFKSLQTKSNFLLNSFSFGICGLIGVLLNLIILTAYSVTALGVFNQAYASYIFLSQIAAFGIHLATLRYIARYNSIKHQNRLLTAALLVGSLSSIAVIITVIVLLPYIHWLFNSQEVSTAIAMSLPGLFFFTLNKIMLAFLNGRQAMHAYAFFTALRFILILFALLLLTRMQIQSDWLTLILTIGEFFLFPLVFLFCLSKTQMQLDFNCKRILPLLFRFARRTALGNMLLDINSRVDVLIMGIFTSSYSVGVYSFASVIAESFNQFAGVLRVLENPKLTACFRSGGISALYAHVKKSIFSNYLLLLPLGIGALIAYPFLVPFLNVEQGVLEGVLVFQILVAGMTLGSGFLPLQTIFNQIGKPWTQTVHLFLFVFSNVALNIILIPTFGMYGAAWATAIAYILHPAILLTLLRKTFSK